MSKRTTITKIWIAAALFMLLSPVVRGQQEAEEGGGKKYLKDAPMRWDLVRRLAEQVLEEYLPKAGAVLKAFNANELDNSQKFSEAIGAAYSDWSDVLLYQKKTGDRPADQAEWEKDYNDFMTSLLAKGKRIARWMSWQAIAMEAMTREAENAPVKFEELKKSLLEADAVLTEAQSFRSGTWSREQQKEAPAMLEKVKAAVNLSSAVFGTLIQMRKFGKDMRANTPGLGTEEKTIIESWKGLPDEKSAVLKSLRQTVKDWIPIVQGRLDAEIKAKEAFLKAYDPVINETINSTCKFFTGRSWDGWPDVAKWTQTAIERKIVSEGKTVFLTSEQEKAEEELTKTERTRLLEIDSQYGPSVEKKLILAEANADSDSDKKAAASALAKFQEDKKKADREYAGIVDKHTQRRKKLGLPPAF